MSYEDARMRAVDAVKLDSGAKRGRMDESSFSNTCQDVQSPKPRWLTVESQAELRLTRLVHALLAAAWEPTGGGWNEQVTLYSNQRRRKVSGRTSKVAFEHFQQKLWQTR